MVTIFDTGISAAIDTSSDLSTGRKISSFVSLALGLTNTRVLL